MSDVLRRVPGVFSLTQTTFTLSHVHVMRPVTGMVTKKKSTSCFDVKRINKMHICSIYASFMSEKPADTGGHKNTILTLGGASAESQKTLSVGDIGVNGDKGEMTISDMELL